MCQPRVSLLVALALACGQSLAAPITQGAPAAVPAEEFRIMTEAEIEAHKRIMATLKGTKREEYRNAHYARLKERAQTQGFLLPDTPPWGRTEVVPAIQAPTAMEAMIARQREVVQQAMEGVASAQPEPVPRPAAPTATLRAPEPAPASEPVAGAEHQSPPPAPTAAATVAQPQATTSTPTADQRTDADTAPETASSVTGEHYRELMRNRFDAFLAQRHARSDDVEQRLEQAEQQRDQELAEIQARRDAHKAEVERRRKAFEEQARRQAKLPPPPLAPTPPPPPHYGYGYPYTQPFAQPNQPYYYPQY